MNRRKNIAVGAGVALALCLAVTGGVFYYRGFHQRKEPESLEAMAEPIPTEEPGDGGAEASGPGTEPGDGGTEASRPGTEPDDGEAASSADNAEPAGRKQRRVKGIYVTGPTAGSASMDDLIALVDETELNTMVIDVKNDEGRITFAMDRESVQETGACISYISDMDALMAKLKEHDIYTIARIICFKDPCLAEHRPELALKKPDGTTVKDGYGLTWVNPCEEEVWDYLIEIAEAAADVGFDEIQYDYVRFPIGSDAEAADYGMTMEDDTRKQEITAFLSRATQRLHDRGVAVTADVFGTIIGNETDVVRVGQDYAELARTVDVLSPMVYPSHYGNGVFGFPVPDAEPYGTVYAALTDSARELGALEEKDRAIVRPWLQAFTATWVDGHIDYGGEQIREQIQAVYDAGYEEWILWNAVNRYSGDGLLPEQDR